MYVIHLTSSLYWHLHGLKNQILHCGSGSVCTWFIFSGLSNVRTTLHHFQRRMKCQRCSWPCALLPSSRFHQTPCPQAQVLLHGPREQALTFEDRDFFFLYICFQDEGKIGHLLLLIFPMSALSQWPSFESFIYSGSLSKLLHRSVFQCRRVLLSVLLLRNHNMYFMFVFCTKSHYCPPFLAI